jgi:hypothetical protein
MHDESQADTKRQAAQVVASPVEPQVVPGPLEPASQRAGGAPPHRDGEHGLGPQNARLGPALWLRTPIRGLDLAHDFGQYYVRRAEPDRRGA